MATASLCVHRSGCAGEFGHHKFRNEFSSVSPTFYHRLPSTSTGFLRCVPTAYASCHWGRRDWKRCQSDLFMCCSSLGADADFSDQGWVSPLGAGAAHRLPCQSVASVVLAMLLTRCAYGIRRIKAFSAISPVCRHNEGLPIRNPCSYNSTGRGRCHGGQKPGQCPGASVGHPRPVLGR